MLAVDIVHQCTNWKEKINFLQNLYIHGTKFSQSMDNDRLNYEKKDERKIGKVVGLKGISNKLLLVISKIVQCKTLINAE